MNTLPTREIIKLTRDFVGMKEWNNYSKQQKLDWINSYRKAEKENNEQIELAGGVENWYESGQGRLINF